MTAAVAAAAAAFAGPLEGVRSCASCDVTECGMNRRHGVEMVPAERSAFVLDHCWPEYASMVAASARPGDQLLAPGLVGRPMLAQYRWPGRVAHRAAFATARRHLAMRRVAAAPGGVRQREYLRRDRALAHALARRIDYRARHLVVAQAWLPWLDEAGALGGRTYDVLMSRYPFGEIHQRLDRVAAGVGRSATIADFRADPGLVAREAELLAGARRIVTPHHGIADLFPDRALRLAWHRPAPSATASGTRVAFLGPTITRQRPDVVRALAGALDAPLVVFGAMLAGPDYWDGVPVELRAMGPNWLDGIGAILHPAALTHEPRALLQAAACGVQIYATRECGLDPADWRPIGEFAAPQRT